MKKILKVLALVLCFSILTQPVFAVVKQSTRLFGANRYQTATEIALQYNSGFVNSVVLVPGSSFANALPASVLAEKHKAPLLLLDSTAARTQEAFTYILSHLTKIGTIYLVGDKSLIGNDFEAKLNQMGYKNIVRISGEEKYETAFLIAKELNAASGTSVVLSSGENFPDALAVSSFAAAYGWPILLVGETGISPRIKQYIEEKQPANIYLTGGTTVIHSALEEELKKIAPNAQVRRFAGSDRYETAIQIAKEFAPTPSHLYVASGFNFPDALAGSVLAAKNYAPIILVNPQAASLHSEVKAYLQTIKRLQKDVSLTFFGGTAVIPLQLEELICKESGFITDDRQSMEDEVISLVNKERAARGLEALVKSEVLANLARLKAQDMAAQGYFGHESPIYGDPNKMLKSFGVSYQMAGENIASGQTSAEMVMNSWMNSPLHRENILKQEYLEIGVGLAKDGNGQTYWVQLFIRPN
ncbi:MAG TPA: hypothetical protein GXX46_03355 [Peptococcaceae bacterium]|nr:hypothetical protein [Peptococcaceae bacterium]